MPRLRGLTSSTLQRLDEELRFEPPAAARRQLERVEILIEELLDDSAAGRAQPAYPEAWIEFRVTGLKRDGTGGEARRKRKDSEVNVVFDALLTDLAALTQRLSKRAEVRATMCVAPEWLSIAELRARWGVSEKSVERAIERGLASRRVIQDGGRGGRERTAFRRRIVEAFERKFGVPQGGAARLSKREVATATRWARGYQRRLGWSLDAAAKRIAERLGRSRQGVRNALQRQVGDEAPLARAQRGGSEPGEAASSRGAVRARRERLSRLARLRGLALDGPLVSDDGIVEATLATPSVREHVPPPTAVTLAQMLALPDTGTTLSVHEERAIARAAGVLVQRARATIAAIDRLHPSAVMLGRAETDLRWAGRLRARLVGAQLPLVVRTLRTQAGIGGQATGLLAAGALPPRLALAAVIAGVRALIGAAGMFDPWKGGRLAAPASLAVGRAVGAVFRGEAATGTPGAVIASETRGRALARSASVDLGAPAWDGFGATWHSAVDIQAAETERLSSLGADARGWLSRRFGLDGQPPMTLEEAARVEGISVQKARARERAALRVAGVVL